MSDTVVVALVAGLAAIVGALIAQIGEGIRQRRKRKYEKADSKEAVIEATSDKSTSRTGAWTSTTGAF